MLVGAATEAIHRFEPRAEVRNVTFENDESFSGRLIPIAEVDIIDD
jgi:phage baseplate assembly protein W